MNEVWILFVQDSYEDETIKGVFSSKKIAEAIGEYSKRNDYCVEGYRIACMEINKIMSDDGSYRVLDKEIDQLEKQINDIKSIQKILES